jgi:ferredoxin
VQSGGEGAASSKTFRYPVAWKDPDFYNEKKLEEEMRRVFDVCHGCRLCYSLCDSFPTLFDMIDESKTGELDSVDSSKFKKVVDSCTLCDLCFMSKCPYVPPHGLNVDFPHLMLRYRAVENNKANTSVRILSLSFDENLNTNRKSSEAQSHFVRSGCHVGEADGVCERSRVDGFQVEQG